jgi:tetratricopeptide (TPR) repeat protein
MPSLEQLKKFKASFSAIADETAVLSQLDLPPDDLQLPDSEPVAPPPPVEPAPPQAAPPETPAEEAPLEAVPGPGAQTLAGGETAPENLGLGFDFADLLGGGPANLPPPPAAEAVIEEAFAKAAPEISGDVAPDAGEDGPGIPDLSFDSAFDETEDGDKPPAADDIALDDEDLDAPFADFDNAGIGDTGVAPEFSAGDDFGPDLGLDFQDLPDFDDTAAVESGGETPFPDIAEDAADLPDFSGIDLGLDAQDFPGFGDAAAGDEALDLPGFGGIDSGPEPLGFPAEEAESGALEGLLDGFADDIESGRGAEAGEEGGETDFGAAFPDLIDMTPDSGGIDFPEPETGLELSPESSGAADPFDNFSPDGGEAGFGGGEGSGAQPVGETEFALPGIEDLFGGNAPKIAGMGAPSGTAESAAPEDTVEEIRLDEYELNQLQSALSGYPLNLRIAIEEIIAEQAIAPNLMSSLIKLLARKGSPKEAAALAAKILGKPIPIPRGFEKKTGEELEAEQASFRYIFVNRFLPTLRLFLFIAMVAASLFYLGRQFIYIPVHANSIYRQGYELIPTGTYAQANEHFNRALQVQRQKNWFYQYAEAFREERQYIYAEEKYDQLLRFFPRDKKGALDYAKMETDNLRNYAKADRIIRHNLLEYAIDDREGLMALGDNNLIWGEIDPSRYEEARGAYARLLEVYGWQDPIVEGMLKYFIRVDKLGEVLPLQQYFTTEPDRRSIAASTLAELGGYLLDKRFEEVRGVPDEHIGRIEGIRDILLRAVRAGPRLPEAHYHLARYYARFGNRLEERQTLEIAARAFDIAQEESARRTRYRLDTYRRLGEILINNREFFAAEEQLVKGVALYEDALDRRFLTRSPEFGRLYANLGDLEYFAKSGNMSRALEYYLQSELNAWAPPEIRYRIGAAHYQQEQWGLALDRFFDLASAMPANRRLLNALGNVSYLRGDYFNAQGYYSRLMAMLDTERARFPLLMPNDRPEHLELAERMMVVRNNLAVTLEALTRTTGNHSYRSRALGLYAESERAWDALTRNPSTMIRSGAGDLSSPGMNLAFLNSRNTLYPEPDYEPQIYIHIDRDLLEPSDWEDLVPRDSRLADLAVPYR